MNEGDVLLAWVGAQVDEDERVARAATVGPWEWGPSLGKITWALDGPSVPFGGRVLGTSDHGCPSIHDAEHIARWDPARVLLGEVPFKRCLLEMHCPDRPRENWYWPSRACKACHERWHALGDRDAPPTQIGPEVGCRTVRALASLYAARPGFQAEWLVGR